MSRFPEIASLFAALASNLRTPDPTVGNEIDLSISNLNRSLNPSEAPSTRILDTALSLMCFTAPQLYDSAIEYSMRTIITVLSSSIECKALRIDNDQRLRIGGSIRKNDCANVMEWCVDVLGKLREHNKGDLCDLVLYSVIRLTALAPRAIPSKSNLEMKFNDERASSLVGLLCHLPNEFKVKNAEVPLRLLLWHLDPMILKQDVSEILKEVTERPFICLSTELYGRMEWRSKVICLVISPSIFVQTRALLHKWFLVTGLASIMELQTELVVQVLDVISRPMWWGISMEVGSKLPFSHAYFPYDYHSFRTLSGPISQENFQHLLNKLSGSISHGGEHLHTSSKKTSIEITMVDHKSMWAMAMNFPGWFYFASVLLFYENGHADSSYSGFISGSAKPYLLHDVKVPCSVVAARYIAWILNPMNKSYQDLYVDYLGKVSELWTMKLFSSNKSNGATGGRLKETRRLKLHEKNDMASHEVDSRTVWFWLNEFKEMYTRIFETKVGLSPSNVEGFKTHQSLFLRWIPLGILIGYLNHLNAGGCSLLLHFAATGTIKKFSETQKIGLNQKRLKCGWQGESFTWTDEYTKAEAIAGCRVVFYITDISETISSSMLETEEEVINFVCQVKLKTVDYLLKCIKRMLKLDGDGLMRKDLLARVMHWRRQGKYVFENNKDLDHVYDSLNVQ